MKKLKRIDIYTIPLLFVALATVVLRSFALLTAFNPETMHFDNEIAISISSVIVALAVIGFLSYLIFGEKERALVVKNDGAASYIPAGIVSTALTFIGSIEARSRRLARSSSSVVFQLWNFIFAFGFIFSSLSLIVQCRTDTFLHHSFTH